MLTWGPRRSGPQEEPKRGRTTELCKEVVTTYIQNCQLFVYSEVVSTYIQNCQLFVYSEVVSTYIQNCQLFVYVGALLGPPKKSLLTLPAAVQDLVYSDRRIQVEEIAQALGISHGSVSTILHERLGVRKLTAHWVPKSLSDEQMATRASVCSALLKPFRSKDDFLLRLVIVDEDCVHYYEPKNKAQSRQWVGPGSPRPKKFKTQPSAGKVMATVFWDTKGVIMLDFLPKRSTITGVNYASLLD